MIFASTQRAWTAPAVPAVGARRGNSMRGTTTRVAENKKAELKVAEDAEREGVDPFAEFKSVLGEDEECEAQYDPLRQGPLRYLGYSNEVGEAFRAWLFQGGVPLSYAIAIGYVLFDTADKWRKALEDAEVRVAKDIPGADRDRLVAAIGLECGLDTIVWQLLASVAIPGSTIHVIVALTGGLVQHALEENSDMIQNVAATTSVPADVILEYLNKSLPTCVGLLAIPFIVHPIDSGVHALLNYTTRPLLRSYICNNGGREASLPACRDCRK